MIKLILFEDADITFPDEEEFYFQLKKLIPSSKVPIILTSDNKGAIEDKLINQYFKTKEEDDGFVRTESEIIVDHEVMHI